MYRKSSQQSRPVAKFALDGNVICLTGHYSVSFNVTQCNSLPFNFTLCHSMSLCVTQCHLPAWWAAGDTCVRLFEDGGPPGELVQVGSVDLAKEWGHHMQSWNLKQRVFLHIMWKRIKRTYLFFVSLYTPNAKFFSNLFVTHLTKKKITLLILMHLRCFIVREKKSWFTFFVSGIRLPENWVV